MMEIDLEELAEKIGWRGKHADKLIVSRDGRKVVVVEKTGRPKTDDVRKLDNTIRALKEGPLREALGLEPAKITKIIAVIHASKRLDTMIAKILASRTKGNIIYRKASCRELDAIMKEHGIRRENSASIK